MISKRGFRSEEERERESQLRGLAKAAGGRREKGVENRGNCAKVSYLHVGVQSLG